MSGKEVEEVLKFKGLGVRISVDGGMEKIGVEREVY